MKSSYRVLSALSNLGVYVILILFALIMLFPFIFMFSTSFKYQKDTFRYPPRLIPHIGVNTSVEGEEEPKPLYYVNVNGEQRQYALVQENIKVGIYADPNNPDTTYERRLSEVKPTGGVSNQQKTTVDGKEYKLFDVTVDGQIIPMIQVRQTAYGRFVDLQNPEAEPIFQNVRLSTPVEQVKARPENYAEVTQLQGLDRSLTNTILVTLLVVIGQLVTSVLGGYALARLRFPGRDALFVIYLGTIMIPFVVLITPLYQLMVAIGWVNKLSALIIPWIFTAYGTFLMCQFFITIPMRLKRRR
jgi:multiple sugar transport system permease protein